MNCSKKLFFLLPFFLCIGFLSCGNTKTMPVFHSSHIPNNNQAPFSDVVETKDFLFLAGQIGKDRTAGTLAKGGIKSETKQAILNIKEILEHHNSSLNQVVKCTVILKDINDFKAFNSVYVQYFPNKPARTTFAADLAGGAAVEIEATAAK